MKRLTRSELIESVLAEMEHVWGPEGFGGEAEAYTWLNEHFGISEEDDLLWQHVLSDWAGTFDEDTEDFDEDEKERLKALLQDETTVSTFLNTLLQRYKSCDAIYPG